MNCDKKVQRDDRLSDLNRQSARKKERGDCAVKALATVLNVSYGKAHALLGQAGRLDRRGTPWQVTQRALGYVGLCAKDVTGEYNAKTIRTLANELSSRDVLLVRTRGHVLAVRGGMVYDWTEGRLHRIRSIHRILPR